MTALIAAIGFVVFASRRLLTYLHLFQQEEYDNPRFLAWLWRERAFDRRLSLVLLAVLVAAAGLPPRRSPAARLRMAARRWAFRLVRSLTPNGPARDRLRERFGSADYRQAGKLRPILVKAVGEDLSDVARAVRCPAVLVYGDRDTETPPELGTRFNALMPGSRLVLLRGFDHWSVLTEGRHQIAQRLGEFLEEVA